MKLSTDSGEKNLAVPLVGKTWLGPAKIVAERLGRIMTEKNAACVIYSADILHRIFRLQAPSAPEPVR